MDCHRAKHILRYLPKNLHYEDDDQQSLDYTDSDWGGAIKDKKSYFSYVVACPYVALLSSTKEAIFLKRLLEEMNYRPKDTPITTKGDNLTKNQKKNV